MNLYSSLNQLHRNPDPDGLGGGAASGGSPDAGAAPAAEQAAFSIDEPTWKSTQTELQELRSFRDEANNRFREYDTRLNPKTETKDENKRPSMKDFDFNKEGEFERYQDEVVKYNLKEHQATWQQQQSEARQAEEAEQRTTAILQSHASRQDAFKAANPDYDPNKSISFRNPAITLAIADSEFSAQIHHFLNKNPDKLSELRSLERDKGAVAALRYVGRLEASMESQKAGAASADKTVRANPTKAAFPGGLPTKKQDKSVAELREFYG